MAALVMLVVLCGMVMPQHAARAAPSPVAHSPFNSPPEPGAIRLHACVAPVRHGDTAAKLFASPDRFDCRRAEAAWGAGSYWVRLDLPPGSRLSEDPEDMPNRYLRFAPQWQRMITVHTRLADGRIVSRSYDNQDLSPLMGIGAAVGIPLEKRVRLGTQIMVRLDGALNAAGLVVEPQLMRGTALRGAELAAAAIFSAFAGLGIGLFCYNMVLWLTIRERFQLTYCLSLLAMLAYVWASSGAMSLQAPSTSQVLRIETSYLMLAFVGALALQFITDFIEPHCLPARLRRFARNVGLASIAAAVAVILVPEAWRPLADRAYVLTFIPLPPLVAAIGMIAWRRGSGSVRVLAIAWAMPLVMAVLRIAHALHLVELSSVVEYSLVIGMSIEALLSSLAMSYRIKLVTEERDQALADERAARHLANVDGLTGLLNRRALLEQVIAWSSPEPLRLLLVDIDHFKQINDRHGHLVGDEVLRDVAEVMAMRAELRGSVARLGGEEFALIGTSDELSEGLALAILADMRAKAMGGHVRLTVSIGMAEGMVRCEDEWRDLYRRGDIALYRAKSEGRNRAVHAGPGCAVSVPIGPFVSAAAVA
ncbi:diguanylate cyclase [Novosphingobium flavum]|uniref:diguanylate cyclase n=1 Tax=Novosphingobium flavum TaxID=1778672 RepID=A0A7X1FRK4_9SPHN|nr:diguanylate cyclase [Novosphingobium flavum]MBC2665661.1 diguanylate cyclase [Novosphingobium flavum]